MSKTTNKFAPEVRDRAVRMVFDHERDHPSRWAAVVSIAEKIGCVPQALLEWEGAGRLDLAKNGERLMRRDLRDRNGADQWIGLGKQPTDLVDGHGREAVALAFDEPFLGNRLEGVGGGVFGGDPRRAFFQRRIDPRATKRTTFCGRCCCP